MQKQIKKWNKLYQKGKLDIHELILSRNFFKAHTSHANTYKLKNKLFNQIEVKEYLDIN